MVPSKNDPEYMTKSECFQISSAIRKDMDVMKKALVGDDMRGGIVKDLSEIKTALKNNSGTRGLGRKEKAIIYSSLIGTTGLIIVELIRCFA